MTNYGTIVRGLRAADTLKDIRKCEKAMVRLSEAGRLTPSEFEGLDNKLIARLVVLDLGIDIY